jgi:hypothetical protein
MGQEMLVARLVFGHGTLKTIERGSPKFHAVQIIVKACEGLNKITDNHLFGRFRHGPSVLMSTENCSAPEN